LRSTTGGVVPGLRGGAPDFRGGDLDLDLSAGAWALDRALFANVTDAFDNCLGLELDLDDDLCITI
jgi:hypothetical protein